MEGKFGQWEVSGLRNRGLDIHQLREVIDPQDGKSYAKCRNRRSGRHPMDPKGSRGQLPELPWVFIVKMKFVIQREKWCSDQLPFDEVCNGFLLF